MIRRRLYNPAQLTPEELKESFVARQDILERMLELLSGQECDHPCQHMMLVGPRGMGKTTLGLRFLHAVTESLGFAADWQPVPFHEESYGIGDLADFWLAALRHLARATGDSQWSDRADALLKDEGDPRRLAAYARAALSDFHREDGKRPILFVENLDAVFEQFRDEREIHGLRASLIERPDLLLIGSANAVFDGIRGHGEPFYEFFRLFILEGLTMEETRRLVAAFPDGVDNESEMPIQLAPERGRLETIRRLTGGNPRLMVLACQMLVESPLGEAYEVLERLIDEQTPYFKARIEALPAQARKVFHGLAEGWTPMLAREVAHAAKLDSSHASAQLKLLATRGYVRDVRLPRERRVRYEVVDRFYNIYVLLRFSHGGRERLGRLVTFLQDLFGREAMRTMYPTALAALETRGASAEEVADWLSVLAHNVASDDDFEQRETWKLRAIGVATRLIGPKAPVIGEINRVGWAERGFALIEEVKFAEAATAFLRALEEGRNDWFTHAGLGFALFELEEFERAAAALGHVLDLGSEDDARELRHVAANCLSLQKIALVKLDRHDEAINSCERLIRYVRREDPDDLRGVAVKALLHQGGAFSKSRNHDHAIAFLERVGKYTSPDDPSGLRYVAVLAHALCGFELQELNRHDEAIASWRKTAIYALSDDPTDVRFVTAISFCLEGIVLSNLKRYDEAVASCKMVVAYIRPDDPSEQREKVSGGLAAIAGALSLSGKLAEAETVCRLALGVTPECGAAWHVQAVTVVRAGDAARLTEAEDYARRAAGLLPVSCPALRTLSDILAARGEWKEALEWLEKALRLAEEDDGERSGLISSLISAVVANHGRTVKEVMERTGADRTMEPLWHAVRADLGEGLGPLPAEIADAANGLLEEFARRRGG
ncbi:MAG: AAA family ATPase [Alphaproteobacteria bacterium]|nr:AAA family ATPase [Alphaproteobacteria bacterium]